MSRVISSLFGPSFPKAATFALLCACSNNNSDSAGTRRTGTGASAGTVDPGVGGSSGSDNAGGAGPTENIGGSPGNFMTADTGADGPKEAASCGNTEVEAEKRTIT